MIDRKQETLDEAIWEEMRRLRLARDAAVRRRAAERQARVREQWGDAVEFVLSDRGGATS